MAKTYNITITNGVGSANVLNGSYNVTSSTKGYLDTSITPNTLNVTEGSNSYELEISAEGALTLRVTDTGESTGTPIVGATFKRCDSQGNEYGDLITTNENGLATFANVPYDASAAPLIYYKQISTDEYHTFDSGLKNYALEVSTKTIDIENPLPPIRTFTLKDKNYEGLLIESGTITLN